MQFTSIFNPTRCDSVPCGHSHRRKRMLPSKLQLNKSQRPVLRRRKWQPLNAPDEHYDETNDPTRALLDNGDETESSHPSRHRSTRGVWRRSTVQNVVRQDNDAACRRRPRGMMSSWLSSRKNAVLNSVFHNEPSSPHDDSTQSNTRSQDCSNDPEATVEDSNNSSGEEIQVEGRISFWGSPTASIDDLDGIKGINATNWRNFEAPPEEDDDKELCVAYADKTTTSGEEDQTSSSQLPKKSSSSSTRHSHKKKKEDHDSKNIIGMIITFDPTSHLLRHNEVNDEMFTSRTQLRELQKIETYCDSLLGDGCHSADDSSTSSSDPMRLLDFDIQEQSGKPKSVQEIQVHDPSFRVEEAEEDHSISFVDRWDGLWSGSWHSRLTDLSTSIVDDTSLKVQQQQSMPNIDFEEVGVSPPALIEVEGVKGGNEEIEIVFYKEDDDESTDVEDNADVTFFSCRSEDDDESAANLSDRVSQVSPPPYNWFLPDHDDAIPDIRGRHTVRALLQRQSKILGEDLSAPSINPTPLFTTGADNGSEDYGVVDNSSETSSNKFFRPNGEEFSVASDISGASAAVQSLLALCKK